MRKVWMTVLAISFTLSAYAINSANSIDTKTTPPTLKQQGKTAKGLHHKKPVGWQKGKKTNKTNKANKTQKDLENTTGDNL